MPDVLLLPQVNLLQSSAHRTTVQKRSFNVIIAIYKQIYGNSFFPFHFLNLQNIYDNNSILFKFLLQIFVDRVHDPDSNFGAQSAILNKTPEQLNEYLTF